MLKGKVALVTGASRGIGRAIAQELAMEGAYIIINYKNGKDCAIQVETTIRERGGHARILQADTGDTTQLRQMVNTIVKEEGKIDILVNNAGICPFMDFFEITEEIWDITFKVNLKGYFFLTQLVAKHMVDMGIKGRIINISSISGLVGSATQVHYCSTKGGINVLTKACAIALAPYGITVNAVLPGTVATDANVSQLADERIRNQILSRTPLTTFGRAEDIAEAVKYFASDKSGWTTGSLLVVDGGYTA
ncbi:MAG: SDR family NAD(P)-dependent oxidoreductase [Mahellales bacterium]